MGLSATAKTTKPAGKPMANFVKRPTKIDMDVGARMRALRVQSEMSQTTVGNALGLTFQQIQKYEKGTNRIGPARLAAMAKMFKVPVAAFFGDAANANGNGHQIIDPAVDTRI